MSVSVSAVEAAANEGIAEHPYWDRDGKAPIRGELYGPEHLDAHARALAEAGRGALVVRGFPLLKQFEGNQRALIGAHRHITEAYRRQETLGTEAEWLLDNFHIIIDALREIRNDLPSGYYRRLPKLVGSSYAGYPRVYALAVELIAHCDSSLNESNITRFVRAYQTVVPLTIGELWAVPAMLRLMLIDNLRRLADQVVQVRTHCSTADAWVEEALKQEQAVRSHVELPADVSDQFVLRVLEHVRDLRAGADGMAWLEGALARRGWTLADVMRREQQRQAANQLSIGNCVTSLRLLSALDWTVFFERTSLVEEILNQDPAGCYARQEFATRDRCRKTIEGLARGSGLDELQVARWTINLARGHGLAGPPAPPGDCVAYYLLDRGRRPLERHIGFSAPVGERPRRFLLAHPALCYFGSAVAIMVGVLAGVTTLVDGFASPVTFSERIGLWLVALLPASELAVALVNTLVNRLVPPRALPKLEFKEGIPADCATLIVIPTLLTRPENARALVEQIEVHYLSNPDPQLWFALLTDFVDAPTEHRPEDQPILDAAVEGIQELNRRYAAGGPERFFLCHRRRTWNAAAGCWMGWERKRGKLSEFNRLLRGDRSTTYATVSGDLSKLPRIRFVITLDADTKLPRETARRLLAALAHPLNQPRFDPGQGRVVAGYGVLQPRISLSLRGAGKSWFARAFAGSAGIDPYITAVSDVYQDLFAAGSFTGKGIYDVDAFEAATGSTFPENHILSHDLIEGNYARCGLASDIEFLDEFPAHYAAYARREHRWVRGDWQLLPWLLPRVPAPAGRRPNPLPLLERWKISDNLRRSLLPPALVMLLVLGWTVLPGAPWIWTALAALVLGFPIVLQCLDIALQVPGAVIHRRWPMLPAGMSATAGQVGLLTSFLCHQAWLMMDAITRTLVRLTLTRRHLLEWETAAATESRMRASLVFFFRSMWAGPTIAVLVLALLSSGWPSSLLLAWPFLAAWAASPLIAYLVSRPRVPPPPHLTREDRRRLRLLTRRTWSFFEDFVGPEDHYLPPDNYQEDPKGEIAHRTSPTNMGLYLLAGLAAHDLGYITLGGLLDRLEKTFDTLEKLERSHNHVYNWYDTTTLQPLQPAYISTVDSGNFLASLIALQHGLEEKAAAPVAAETVQRGLADTFDLAREAFTDLEPPGDDAPAEIFRAMDSELASQTQMLSSPIGDGSWLEWLRALEAAAARLKALVERFAAAIATEPEELKRWTAKFVAQVRERAGEWPGTKPSPESAERCRHLAERARVMALAMDFRFLYTEQRHLFSVGYNLSQGRNDNVHYDLLASEAALTSYLAVARGDVPLRHWFQLGRPLTRVHGALALISWGGTMFEYLMPRLLFRSIPETLLDESRRTAVARQIEYGRQRRVPWGISESAFSVLDGNLNYQYQAFGVPGLGLKRGLVKDLVIAPYATALAIVVDPEQTVQNFRALAEAGGLGACGFYEALDYTAERVPPNAACAVVKCFMAHHQAMSLLALTNFLCDDIMPRRFHTEPAVRAAELLLEERVPRGMPVQQPNRDEVVLPPPASPPPSALSRRLNTPFTSQPRTHVLSNGRYTVMITSAGSGRSMCAGLDMTRWREDGTCDSWGQFCFIRDLRSRRVWCAGYQPLCSRPDEYEVVFATDKAELRRLDGRIETHLEVTVSPEDRAEIRRVVLTNHDRVTHELEVTSYAEIVLLGHGDDLAHPAFGKLFLETEFVPGDEALLCRRRPRSREQKPAWGIHVLAADGPTIGHLEYETDRGRFLGRGRAPANPAAMDAGAVLSGTTGPVLDPVFSLRRRVRLAPDTSVSVAFTTAFADSREEALSLADHYHDFHGVTRAFELAWAHSQLELRHLHISAEEAHLYQRIAAHLFFAGPALRAASAVLAANSQGVTGLWRHGISGDNPIVLVWIERAEELPIVRQLLLAHAFWRSKGLQVDLVILNEHETGYFEDLHQELQTLVHAGAERPLLDKPGGVFLRKAAQISREDQVLLQSAARCLFSGKHGPLAKQVERLERTVAAEPISSWPRQQAVAPVPGGKPKVLSLADLHFTNRFGGFTADGREYHIFPGQDGSLSLPPAPWCNVVATPSFGFLVSETGAGCTWAGNSQSNRLTPWNNDPVSDPPGEVVYLRDEASEEVWTVTPLPLGQGAGQRVRHGQGYTIFEQETRQLEQELLLFAAPDDPIKVIRLTVHNRSRRPRRLSATFYVDWVLGTVRDNTALHIVTDMDAASGAVLARNAFNSDFAGAVAFADVDVRPRTYTADRTEFLGRNGSIASPAALGRKRLTGATGPALDPCAVLQVPFSLQPDEERTITFFLGQAARAQDVVPLLQRYKTAGHVDQIFQEVRERWDTVLTTIQVHTPNPALDLLLNRWLLYQVLSCRLWGRTAFYQSSGAYGFRDQLQDVLSLVHAAPGECRAHILRAAGRQFAEGDVQHWWHPPRGAGVRTRFSDDLLWLPFAVCHYASVTGDLAILDEEVAFLQAPVLRPEQEEDYRVPETTTQAASLYEHCLRALDHACRLGPHGLPLMGTGDWNDGMNRVGSGGKGESVWNGWFLISILRDFAVLAEKRGDAERAERCRSQIDSLHQALEEHAWDGGWYRRAYFDDGTPLGSAANAECKIDSLPQSWAVISGVADPERARQAFDAVMNLLVLPQDQLITLFTPPFDKSALEPGYVKGYVPGIRENGGQYTHAATWVVQAAALLGKGGTAEQLLGFLNPICHAATPEKVGRYRVEPYVLAGDVAAEPPHTGRGGWTWYTGSAAWFYRVALEFILGFRRSGSRLTIDPCIPATWKKFQMSYRHGLTTFAIEVQNPDGVERGIRSVTIDGQNVSGGVFDLTDDGKTHEIHVVLGLRGREVSAAAGPENGDEDDRGDE